MFDRIIAYLTMGALGIGVVCIYLMVNKIWIRKHERVVAESLSVTALGLGSVMSLPFLITNLRNKEYLGAADGATWLVCDLMLILVGIGLFVPDPLRRGVWRKLRAALRLERTEAGDLAKRLFRPRDPRRILAILHRVAMIDRDLDQRERELIEQFARAWGIEYVVDEQLLEQSDITGDYVALRRAVADYLLLNPPKRQVAELRDLLDLMINLDEKVTEQEALMRGELFGLLDGYISGEGSAEPYIVVIVPQSEAQDEAVRSLLPGRKRVRRSGGTAYEVGSFFSAPYAEMISDKYRALAFLTIVSQERERRTVEEMIV